MVLLDGLSPLAASLNLLLILLSALTSAFTAAVGAGDGVLMIMALAQVMPVQGLGGPQQLYSCYACQ
ncbi:hypothetical protein [Halomonas denitrificans]|uniref:hypothetical protein n=1 Tax=Halomonas denitrificans TaxID=370769 RepID=UPI000D349738|nr:hypothetical protein [Halomonas denitrificans]